jgi:predicted PurR-regulated permease PerM
MAEDSARLESPPAVVRWTFLGILLVALALTLRTLASFLGVLVLSVVTASLLWPVYGWTVRRLGGHRRTAAVLLCLVLMLAVVVPLFFTAQAVSTEALGFYQLTTRQLAQKSLLDVLQGHREGLDRLNDVLSLLGIRLTPEALYDRVASLGVQLGGFFYRQGVSMAKGLVRLVFGFFFWLLSVYYLLVDGPALADYVRGTLPVPGAQLDLLFSRFTSMAGSLVVGNGFAGLLQGLAGGLVFSLLGLPGAVLWGVVMAVLAFIPIVGISLVYVPASLILALSGQPGRALLLFLPLAVIASFVEYWLKPALVGRRMRLHTLLVFLSLLGGLDAFGPMGLLLGPLTVTAFVTLVSIYRECYLPRVHPPAMSPSCVPDTKGAAQSAARENRS